MTELVDGISWIIIAGVMLTYLRQQGLVTYVPPVVSKQNVDEPDVTRWKHDGTQGFEWKSGNKRPVFDEIASDLNSSLSVS